MIAVALVLFMLYGAAPLGQGAVMLYYGVVYCLKLLLTLFNRLLMLLAALFPGQAGEMELTLRRPWKFRRSTQTAVSSIPVC